MDEELLKIAEIKKKDLETINTSWNMGMSRFPLIIKSIKYKEKEANYLITYEHWISDASIRRSYSSFNDIHKVKIKVVFLLRSIFDFSISYKNCFLFTKRAKYNFRISTKDKELKENLYSNKILCDFYSRSKKLRYDFEPYITYSGEEKELCLSFSLSVEPSIEFKESLIIINYLKEYLQDNYQ